MRYPIAYADWSIREYGAIARCILSGRVHHDGVSSKLLAQRLGSMYAPSDVFLLNYAHHGIEMALQGFARLHPSRREVILPAYICPSVPRAVLACGLRVRWVDVQDDLNLSASCVAQALRPDTLAVIVPHMFGCPAPVAEIEDLCRKSGVAMIDDAAQVAGIRINNRLLGTFGDVGVISFAQSKTIVTGVRGSGAALLVNRQEHLPGLREQVAQLPTSSGRVFAFLDFLLNYQWDHYFGAIGYRIVHRFFERYGPPKAVTRISQMDASVALVQCARLDQILEEKIRITAAYHQTLEAFPMLAFPQYAEGRFLARVMFLLPEGVNIDQVGQLARRHGLETRLGYTIDAQLASVAPHAVALSRRLLGVPVCPSMSESDILNICKVLNDAVLSSMA